MIAIFEMASAFSNVFAGAKNANHARFNIDCDCIVKFWLFFPDVVFGVHFGFMTMVKSGPNVLRLRLRFRRRMTSFAASRFNIRSCEFMACFEQKQFQVRSSC